MNVDASAFQTSLSQEAAAAPASLYPEVVTVAWPPWLPRLLFVLSGLVEFLTLAFLLNDSTAALLAVYFLVPLSGWYLWRSISLMLEPALLTLGPDGLTSARVFGPDLQLDWARCRDFPVLVGDRYRPWVHEVRVDYDWPSGDPNASRGARTLFGRTTSLRNAWMLRPELRELLLQYRNDALAAQGTPLPQPPAPVVATSPSKRSRKDQPRAIPLNTFIRPSHARARPRLTYPGKLVLTASRWPSAIASVMCFATALPLFYVSFTSDDYSDQKYLGKMATVLAVGALWGVWLTARPARLLIGPHRLDETGLGAQTWHWSRCRNFFTVQIGSISRVGVDYDHPQDTPEQIRNRNLVSDGKGHFFSAGYGMDASELALLLQEYKDSRPHR